MSSRKKSKRGRRQAARRFLAAMDKPEHADDEFVAAVGHKPVLQRNFSFLSMLGLAFTILNSWTALSVSVSLALPSGGPSAVVWGLAVAGIGNLSLAMSMAEFLSAYPTAGGQYHWAAIVAPPGTKRIASWITGWINVGGWIALACTGGLLASQIIVGLIALFHAEYEPQRWHQFLIYLAYMFLGYVGNAVATPMLPYVNQASLVWSVLGITVISITILSTHKVGFADAKWVFGKVLNETGWPTGVAWMLGLLQGSFGVTAYDAVAHMIEEIPNPSVLGPRIMVGSVLIGMGTGFVFLVVLLFVSGGPAHVEGVINSPQTPLIRVLSLATGSQVGAVCLIMFPLVLLVFACTGFFAASSRMTFAFARERGLPFSSYFAHVHPKLALPLHALTLTLVVSCIFGLVFLGSSSAFNAITSASVIALCLTYAIPVAINCCQARRALGSQHFRLPAAVGWTVNVFGILYVMLTTVLFFFPPEVPATGSSMNYSIVAFAILMILCFGYWFIGGKHYKGPKVHFADDAAPEADVTASKAEEG